MGNPYAGEATDIEAVRALVRQHPEISRYLSHHWRNALCTIQAGAIQHSEELVLEGIAHIAEDLRRVGI
jgi:hypothetical protein